MSDAQLAQPELLISEDAWASLQGAYDMHVHVAPDVIERRIDDIGLAKEFLDRGFRGFALKSHYVPTTERAIVVRKVVPEIEVFGSITLNHSVGGVNPVAVEIAGRGGCRIVWMPTVDAANETSGSGNRTNAKPPSWAKIQQELAAQGIVPLSISVLDGRGRLTAAALDCIDIIAKHNMVLATGHLGRKEICVLVSEARKMGVQRVVVTHAEFPSQNLSADEQRELADMGALIEHCFTTMFTGKAPWERAFANIRATGYERCILSTDLGQSTSPVVSEGFAMFAQRLLDAGFTVNEIRRMAVINSSLLAA
jgi:hypothetical protein